MQSLTLRELASTPWGQRVRIGGRILQVQEQTVTIADAFTTVEIVGITPVLEPNAMLFVEGIWQAPKVQVETILEYFPVQHAPSMEGDVRRFLWKGIGLQLEKRARVLAALRTHFDHAGFIEVETPVLVPCPGLDLHLDGCPAGDGYLITSPEYQMKRLLTGGLPRIFQITRCFRRGELGKLHNPEFTMLEWYRAFAGYEEVMADTEDLLRAAAKVSYDRAEFILKNRRIDLEHPFLRLSVAEAFARYTNISEEEMLRYAREEEELYFRALVEQIEPALATLEQPVFLMDYPISQASLARRKPSDPRYAERFELYAAGIELCNGFGELTDPTEQRSRFEADQRERQRRGLPVYPLDERFLLALEEGMPPASGNALGLDRLVALACGVDSLAEIQAFPAPIV